MRPLCRYAQPSLALLLMWAAVCPVRASAPASGTTLNVTGAGPRALEPTLQQSIRRDYANAWESMSSALQKGDASLLDQYWVGVAHDKLQRLIQDQARAGIQLRYVDKTHQLQAVFYPTDGATLLLHDTASGELQVFASGKLIHSEPVTQKYVVLMTPGADRWFIRVFQSVSNF
jgi:hypothetical protein